MTPFPNMYKQDSRKHVMKKMRIKPRASNCLFTEPGGLPRFRLEDVSEEGVPPLPPPPPAAAESLWAWAMSEGIRETGAGERPRPMLLSGEYFRGRPLFFLAGTMLKPPPEGDPSG